MPEQSDTRPGPGADRATTLAWLHQRMAKAPGDPPVRTLAELQASQARRLRRMLADGNEETQPREETPGERQRRLYERPVARAHALAEEWADDPTPITRAEAARLLADRLDPSGWTETEQPA